MSTELETKLKEITRKMLPHVYPSWLLEDLTECIALASIPQQDVGAEAMARAAWDAGFKTAVGYADNHFHCQGEQRERVWKKYWDAAGRSVPSEYVTCLAQDGCAREKARRIGMTTFPVECTCTHPPKAGVLTEADAIAWMESKGMMWKGLAISTRDVTDHQLITMPDLLVRYVRDLNPEQR